MVILAHKQSRVISPAWELDEMRLTVCSTVVRTQRHQLQVYIRISVFLNQTLKTVLSFCRDLSTYIYPAKRLLGNKVLLMRGPGSYGSSDIKSGQATLLPKAVYIHSSSTYVHPSYRYEHNSEFIIWATRHWQLVDCPTGLPKIHCCSD